MAVTRLREGRIPLLVASGGDDEYELVRDDGILYRVHRFLTSEDFVVTKGRAPIRVLIVGGGGSGTGSNDFQSPNGPPGGVVEVGALATVGVHPVVVGAGGNATSRGINNGNPGGSSSVFGITASGGGSSAARGIVYTTPEQGAPGGATNSVFVYSNNIREFGAQGQHGYRGTPATPGAAGWTPDTTPYFSDIEGTKTAYALKGTQPQRNQGIRDAPPVPNGFGHGGRGPEQEAQTGAGGRGGDGCVIISYPVRRA